MLPFVSTTQLLCSFQSFSILSSTMAMRVRAYESVGLVLKEEPVHDLEDLLSSSQPKA